VKTRTETRHIIELLETQHPDADTELHYKNAYQLLVATILSAQSTDQRVNTVTPALFKKYPDAGALANAKSSELERDIHSTGFFRNKAKSIIGLGKALAERHGGHVPDTMEELVTLPGIGRKTANVLLCAWFRRPAVPVDTHVQRLAGRLGLTDETAPEKIEAAIQSLVPESDWSFTATALIWHGRRVCAARHPACDRCTLRPDCPYPA